MLGVVFDPSMVEGFEYVDYVKVVGEGTMIKVNEDTFLVFGSNQYHQLAMVHEEVVTTPTIPVYVSQLDLADRITYLPDFGISSEAMFLTCKIQGVVYQIGKWRNNELTWSEAIQDAVPFPSHNLPIAIIMTALTHIDYKALDGTNPLTGVIASLLYVYRHDIRPEYGAIWYYFHYDGTPERGPQTALKIPQFEGSGNQADENGEIFLFMQDVVDYLEGTYVLVDEPEILDDTDKGTTTSLKTTNTKLMFVIGGSITGLLIIGATILTILLALKKSKVSDGE
jgi:hypothetical protein